MSGTCRSTGKAVYRLLRNWQFLTRGFEYLFGNIPFSYGLNQNWILTKFGKNLCH